MLVSQIASTSNCSGSCWKALTCCWPTPPPTTATRNGWFICFTAVCCRLSVVCGQLHRNGQLTTDNGPYLTLQAGRADALHQIALEQDEQHKHRHQRQH